MKEQLDVFSFVGTHEYIHTNSYINPSKIQQIEMLEGDSMFP